MAGRKVDPTSRTRLPVSNSANWTSVRHDKKSMAPPCEIMHQQEESGTGVTSQGRRFQDLKELMQYR
jgi:hypothetical protein